MQLSKEQNNAKYQITGYTNAAVFVNREQYVTSIIVTPQHLAVWSVESVANLQSQNLLELMAFKPSIILLGTGNTLVFPDAAITQVLYAHKIGIDVMTTAAACRTYTALTSEGRNVLAALVIEPD
jgi:uncharacterized protein